MSSDLSHAKTLSTTAIFDLSSQFNGVSGNLGTIAFFAGATVGASQKIVLTLQADIDKGDVFKSTYNAKASTKGSTGSLIPGPLKGDADLSAVGGKTSPFFAAIPTIPAVAITHGVDGGVTVSGAGFAHPSVAKADMSHGFRIVYSDVNPQGNAAYGAGNALVIKDFKLSDSDVSLSTGSVDVSKNARAHMDITANLENGKVYGLQLFMTLSGGNSIAFANQKTVTFKDNSALLVHGPPSGLPAGYKIKLTANGSATDASIALDLGTAYASAGADASGLELIITDKTSMDISQFTFDITSQKISQNATTGAFGNIPGAAGKSFEVAARVIDEFGSKPVGFSSSLSTAAASDKPSVVRGINLDGASQLANRIDVSFLPPLFMPTGITGYKVYFGTKDKGYAGPTAGALTVSFSTSLPSVTTDVSTTDANTEVKVAITGLDSSNVGTEIAVFPVALSKVDGVTVEGDAPYASVDITPAGTIATGGVKTTGAPSAVSVTANLASGQSIGDAPTTTPYVKAATFSAKAAGDSQLLDVSMKSQLKVLFQDLNINLRSGGDVSALKYAIVETAHKDKFDFTNDASFGDLSAGMLTGGNTNTDFAIISKISYVYRDGSFHGPLAPGPARAAGLGHAPTFGADLSNGVSYTVVLAAQNPVGLGQRSIEAVGVPSTTPSFDAFNIAGTDTSICIGLDGTVTDVSGSVDGVQASAAGITSGHGRITKVESKKIELRFAFTLSNGVTIDNLATGGAVPTKYAVRFSETGPFDASRNLRVLDISAKGPDETADICFEAVDPTNDGSLVLILNKYNDLSNSTGIRNLINGVKYKVKVRAVNSNGVAAPGAAEVTFDLSGMFGDISNIKDLSNVATSIVSNTNLQLDCSLISLSGNAETGGLLPTSLDICAFQTINGVKRRIGVMQTVNVTPPPTAITGIAGFNLSGGTSAASITFTHSAATVGSFPPLFGFPVEVEYRVKAAADPLKIFNLSDKFSSVKSQALSAPTTTLNEVQGLNAIAGDNQIKLAWTPPNIDRLKINVVGELTPVVKKYVACVFDLSLTNGKATKSSETTITHNDAMNDAGISHTFTSLVNGSAMVPHVYVVYEAGLANNRLEYRTEGAFINFASTSLGSSNLASQTTGTLDSPTYKTGTSYDISKFLSAHTTANKTILSKRQDTTRFDLCGASPPIALFNRGETQSVAVYPAGVPVLTPTLTGTTKGLKLDDNGRPITFAAMIQIGPEPTGPAGSGTPTAGANSFYLDLSQGTNTNGSPLLPAGTKISTGLATKDISSVVVDNSGRMAFQLNTALVGNNWAEEKNYIFAANAVGTRVVTTNITAGQLQQSSGNAGFQLKNP